MIYLLDANVLITAATSFYKFNRVPEYWRWIRHHAEAGNIKMSLEIHGEIAKGTDDLARWVRDRPCKEALLLDESANPVTFQYVLNISYGANLTDIELIKIERDAFLVVYAFDKNNRCVVTSEISKSGKQRANTKLPDACAKVGISCISAAKFLDDLDFRTDWDS